MLNEAKLTKLPRRPLTLIILLLVMFLLVMCWYDRKISRTQNEEQKLRKNISANSFNNPNHY